MNTNDTKPARRRKKPRNSVAAFLTPKPIRFAVVRTVSDARRYLKRGWCPIECSFGPTTVEDELAMDHHGANSDREGVAIRAYRDHFGARRQDPRFVVTGMPDEDLSFAAASLAGVIPHPSLVDKLEGAPPDIRDIWSRDFSLVAEIINRVDTDHSQARRLVDDHWGRLVLAWRLLTNARIWDVTAFHDAVARWRTLLTQRSFELAKLAPSLLGTRIAEVERAPVHVVSEHVAVIDCSLWGFSSVYLDVWLKHAPIVLCYYADFADPSRGRVTVCIKDEATAVEKLGDGGMLRLYPKLKPKGWGGRELIGGSNRDKPLTWNHALAAAKAVDAFIKRRLAASKGAGT